MPISCEPSDLVAASRCYCGLQPRDLDAIKVYLLSVLAGVENMTPAELVAISKCYACIPPNMIKAVEAALLCTVTGGVPPCPDSGGGGCDYQDMQVDWEPTNLKISELAGVQFGPNGNGITSITYRMATSGGPILVNNVWASLVSVSGPNLTSLTGGTGSVLSFRNGGGLVSVDFPSLVSISGQIGINSLPFLTTVNLPLLETCRDIDFDSCTSLVSLSLPSLTSSGGSGSYNDFSGCTVLANVSFPNWVIDDGATLIFTGDALSAASVNHILARCVANAAFVTGTVDLTGGTNSPPSSVGLGSDYAILIARGVIVTVNP